jgi:transposase
LIEERVLHVNRIKGLLFSQGVSGYEPLRRDRRRRLDELRTGDGRPLPKHLKAQIGRELDRLELLLEQIKAVEAERDALLGARQVATPAPAAMLLNIKGIGPEFAAILWSEGQQNPHFRRSARRCHRRGCMGAPCRGIGIAKILKKLQLRPRQGCHPVDVGQAPLWG